MGPSGSGKSTLLNIIAGLIPVTSGAIRYPAFGFGTPPRVGYLFQSDAVFPWRSVERNLTYALEIQHIRSRQRRERAVELCWLVGLDPAVYLRKLPGELSGGELRRVGLGMTMASTPQLLLLDEPTSAVDWLTRRTLQAVIQDVIAGAQSTAVVVTHDVEEAVWLGDRVLVLREGRITRSIDVDLPRPRTDDLRTTRAFEAVEERVIEALAGAGERNP